MFMSASEWHGWVQVKYIFFSQAIPITWKQSFCPTNATWKKRNVIWTFQRAVPSSPTSTDNAIIFLAFIINSSSVESYYYIPSSLCYKNSLQLQLESGTKFHPMGELSRLWAVLSANRPVNELFCRRAVLMTNCPFGDLSYRRTVLSANCLFGELSVG